MLSRAGEAAVSPAPTFTLDSRDDHPWQHPYLTGSNIARFRSYSETVSQFAFEYATTKPGQPNCAFAVNMAQNMYKWARLAKKYGADSTLFLHAMDRFPISMPQWEDFDGEYDDLNDSDGFADIASVIVPDVPTITVPLDAACFRNAFSAFAARNQPGDNSRPLLMQLASSERLRLEVFEAYPQLMSYFDWARDLSGFDVIYAASAPFAAYASGRPYCLFSVGGDLQFDCGRGDSFGRAMTLAFNGGRFLMVSNPHTLGHSRRLGLTNGVYLPYPMDTDRYCPGSGISRDEWVSRYGEGVYVLTTARVDAGVKGHTDDFFRMLIDLAKARNDVRFVFLSWGNSAAELKQRIAAEGVQGQFIVLPPVGKKRLIDYYRSCDLVLDQFVYGYYGATALEAASIGKPVVMHIRSEQYAPLYAGDVAPVSNASTLDEIRHALTALLDDEGLRRQQGEAMRAWVVRNHGEQKTVPLMLALLCLAADQVPLPPELVNPLRDPLSEEEVAYHQACLRPSS